MSKFKGPKRKKTLAHCKSLTDDKADMSLKLQDAPHQECFNNYIDLAFQAHTNAKMNITIDIQN